MKNNILSLLMVLILTIGLAACSTAEESLAEELNEPETSNDDSTNEDTEKQEKSSNDLDEVIDRLLSNNLLVPLGEMPIPEDNPMMPEVLELGQVLYFDPRLSGNDEVSCMTCHIPQLGYGDGRATFELFGGGDGPRNSPTVINAGFYSSNFWDGRAGSLEEQALGPIQDPGEMNMPLDELIPKLQAIPGYEDLFKAAGFEEGITPENIGKALAAFQRQVVVKDTPYDRFLQGDRDALTESEIRGLDLFAGKASCINCHQGENLTDNKFHNIGIVSDDIGRKAVTGDEADLGAIRTPGLYGITHTAPYMSDGSIRTLEEVINYYDRGGDGHENTSSFIFPLNLTDDEKADLLAFLKVLGGEPPMFDMPDLPGLD